MKNKLNIAIVGAGNIANIHAASISDLENAQLAGVFDVSVEHATSFAKKWHTSVYTDYDSLVNSPGVDAVSICTPSGLRQYYSIHAANAKKHVICEKPIEINLERIDCIIKACEANSVTLSGIFNNRYNEVYRRIKLAIDDGSFGKLILGDIYVKWFRDSQYYTGSGWRGTWALDGGGALMNQSIHFVDLLLWLMGPVENVKAFAGTHLHKIEVEDTATAVLQYKSGALGVIEGTTAAVPGLSDRLEIHGENGSVKTENGRIVYWNLNGEGLSQEEMTSLNQYVLGSSRDAKALDYRMHRAQIKETVTAILAGKTPVVDGYEARKAVELILRIYKDAGIINQVR